MKFRHLILALVLALVASPALAQWAQQPGWYRVPEGGVGGPTQATVWRYDFTTATDSNVLDFSVCADPRAKMQIRFDPSISDTSTDATFSLVACPVGTTAIGQCNQAFPLQYTRSDETSWFDLFYGNAPNLTSGNLTRLVIDALTAAVGGDTARVEVRCLLPSMLVSNMAPPGSATTTVCSVATAGTLFYDVDVNVGAGGTADDGQMCVCGDDAAQGYLYRVVGSPTTEATGASTTDCGT